MNRALFTVWLIWLLLMSLAFAPVLIALAAAQMALSWTAAAMASAFHVLTTGIFR